MKKRTKIIGGIVVFFVAVGIFAGGGDDTTTTVEQPKTEQVEQKEQPKVVEPTAEEKAEKEAQERAEAERKEKEKAEKLEAEKKAEEERLAEQNAKEQVALALLNKNYEGMAEVEFREEYKLYTIHITDNDMKNAIMIGISGNIGYQAWDDLVDSFVTLSKTIKNTVGDGYTLQLANPLNSDKVFVIIKDGKVIYDVTKESNSL